MFLRTDNIPPGKEAVALRSGMAHIHSSTVEGGGWMFSSAQLATTIVELSFGAFCGTRWPCGTNQSQVSRKLTNVGTYIENKKPENVFYPEIFFSVGRMRRAKAFLSHNLKDRQADYMRQTCWMSRPPPRAPNTFNQIRPKLPCVAF